MIRASSEALIHAFETTDYFIRTDAEWHTVNIGQPCPEPLRTWLARHCNGPCAWIVTACNPQAQPVGETDNQRRGAALTAWLDATAHHYTTTNSIAQHGDWPAEPGVCILDMDEGLARALALRFDQAAFVAVALNGPAQLIWIDP